MSNKSVKDVLLGIDRQVGFPITPAKIKKAGFDPSNYLRALAAELLDCEDIEKHREKLKPLLELLGRAV